MKIMMGVLSSSWWCEELSRFFISWFRKGRDAISFLSLLPQMKEKNSTSSSSSSSVYSKEKEEVVSVSLLDLPDLTLECIFEKLPPSGLLNMSAVSTSLREKCTSDHLWEKHMNHKWGSLIIGSAAAYREWQCYIASRNRTFSLLEYSRNKRELLGKFSKLSWNSRSSNINKSCSVMDWYLSLETGNFWFPAQIFNREVQNGHVGFMLSCYDAEVSYDSTTNTFKARYPEQGRRTIEENIGWNRLRAPSVETPAHVLHVSDCLNDLKPDDHIEIQWRKSTEFPYGWWHGVVGHLESCNGNMLNCNCHTTETVILEFKQYNPGSKWRQMVVSRNDHREVGNEADGFYGGIRKLYNEEEISMWKGLWPSSTFE